MMGACRSAMIPKGMVSMTGEPPHHTGEPLYPQRSLLAMPGFPGMPYFGINGMCGETGTANIHGSQMGLMGPGQQAPPPYPGQGQAALHQPSTPLFVSPPAKSQRLLHSDAYLSYIEGLTAESPTVSKWDQTLSVKKHDVRLTKEQESRLPSHWLKSKGAHKTMADALWRLRDLMLRDTLNIRYTHNL